MQIIADRRALHRIPELDRELPLTVSYLQESLRKLSCRVFSPMTGAVCALFDFGADSAIALRSDADALPIAENTGLAWASVHPGKMHACGHDGHMAILLEVARRLDGKRLKRNVLLVFQPAEETTGGAQALWETGIFEKYRVEAIFGLHLWPGLEKGTVASRRGAMMSRSCEVTVEITGKGAHVARADEGRDALAAAVAFYGDAARMERNLPGDAPRLLKFGRMAGGTVRNAVPCAARLEGTLRAFDDDAFAALQAGITATAEKIQAATGCRVRVQMNDGYPAVVNPAALYDRVSALVDFAPLAAPSMLTEDFAWYQKHLPGMFFFLGVGDTPPLHADSFTFDEAVLEKGADFLERLVTQLTNASAVL